MNGCRKTWIHSLDLPVKQDKDWKNYGYTCGKNPAIILSKWLYGIHAPNATQCEHLIRSMALFWFGFRHWVLLPLPSIARKATDGHALIISWYATSNGWIQHPVNLGFDFIYILISINYQTCKKMPDPVPLAYFTRHVYRVAVSDLTLYNFLLGHVAGNERALPRYSLLVVQLIPSQFF